MAKKSASYIFNSEVDRFHNNLISYVRGLIFEIKRQNGLNDEELSEIFCLENDEISDFMHENWDGYVDSRFLSILYLLSDCNFDFSKSFYKKPVLFSDTLKEYLDKFSLNRHERNVKELFDLLDIENEEDLETAISAVKEILKERNNGKEEND